jgi:chromosome segregation ATPase
MTAVKVTNTTVVEKLTNKQKKTPLDAATNNNNDAPILQPTLSPKQQGPFINRLFIADPSNPSLPHKAALTKLLNAQDNGFFSIDTDSDDNHHIAPNGQQKKTSLEEEREKIQKRQKSVVQNELEGLKALMEQQKQLRKQLSSSSEASGLEDGDNQIKPTKKAASTTRAKKQVAPPPQSDNDEENTPPTTQDPYTNKIEETEKKIALFITALAKLNTQLEILKKQQKEQKQQETEEEDDKEEIKPKASTTTAKKTAATKSTTRKKKA